MEVTPKPHGEEPSLRAEEILAALDEDQRTVCLLYTSDAADE